MSNKQHDIYVENLIQEYREALDLWNGKDERGEQKIQDLAAKLEEVGINPEDLD